MAWTVDDLIELMNLGAFRDKFVRELSTGSRRIVDLAMCIAHDPKVLLLDEPSSGIAQRETEALGPLLKRIQRETGCALLVIEHDMPLITSISDRMIALELGHADRRGHPARGHLRPAGRVVVPRRRHGGEKTVPAARQASTRRRRRRQRLERVRRRRTAPFERGARRGASNDGAAPCGPLVAPRRSPCSAAPLAGWVEPAAATSLNGAAWWWRAQQDPPVLKAPNVPDGGLMVQGAPDDPTTPEPDGASAIAAVRFTLDQGQTNPVLTLKLVKDQSQAGPNPIILACRRLRLDRGKYPASVGDASQA